jgi:hypothetical protein
MTFVSVLVGAVIVKSSDSREGYGGPIALSHR